MRAEQLPLSPRTTAIIRRSALAHNVRWLRERLPAGTRIMAVVKANAYGHGASLLAPVLQQMGIDAFGVATTVEAQELRDNGVSTPVYLLSPVLPDEVRAVLAAQVVCLVQDVDFVRCLSIEAGKRGQSAEVHLKVDVGMSRFGVPPDRALEVAEAIDSIPHVRLTGIATHFPSADSNLELTRSQWGVFARTADSVARHLRKPLLRHAAASAGVLSATEAAAEMVRCGLLVYGIAPSGHEFSVLGLQPALSLHTRVTAIRRIAAGTAVGYGGTFVAQRATLVATLPVGYGDGYLRVLGNRAQVLLKGKRVPVIGRVCMDQMMVDATDTGAEIGDVVTLIGRQGEEEITVNEIARWLDTTPHEVTTLLSARVQRILVD
ncbi:MAG: alanine racemase [Armatimonadota bacterium]|nr:alanine racemase [bacterium]MDW8319777.1 alanine racemase [Armatimonadota bacterium]